MPKDLKVQFESMEKQVSISSDLIKTDEAGDLSSVGLNSGAEETEDTISSYILLITLNSLETCLDCDFDSNLFISTIVEQLFSIPLDSNHSLKFISYLISS